MPRTKSKAELDAMPTKNQSTQCHIGISFGGKKEIGIQAFARSDLYDSIVKGRQSICCDCKNKTVINEKTTKPGSMAVVLPHSKTTTDRPKIVAKGINVNKESQTEIFGFIVAPDKWDEINSFSNSRKRKTFVDKQCGTIDEDYPCKKPALEVTEEAIVVEEKATLPAAILAIKSFLENLKPIDISFSLSKTYDGRFDFLEVSLEKGLLEVTPSFYLEPSRLRFSSDGKLYVETLFKKVTEETFFNFENQRLNVDVVNNSLATLTNKHVFCPGIAKEECVGLENTKNLEKVDYPFERYQSQKCSVWFVHPINASKEKIRDKIYQCNGCRILKWYIRDCQKKQAQVTPKTKLKRQLVQSRCRMSVLTPRSKRNRLLKCKRNRSSLNHKIKHLERKLRETSLELSTAQDKEMRAIVDDINLNGQEELQNIFEQAMKKNKLMGLALKKAWEANSKGRTENDFQKDQERCTTGSKGNRWSPLTYRLCKAVYACSPAAYERFRSFEILNLPSCHTLRRKIREIPSKAGIDLIHLKNEVKRFEEHSKNHPEFNNPPKEGALIFDEVKIIGKMIWNSRNGEFIGTAMDDDENASLADLFKVQKVQEILEAEYALQYLWRCTSMNFDVIGPYFMFSKPVTHAAISTTLLKCLYAFCCIHIKNLLAYSTDNETV